MTCWTRFTSVGSIVPTRATLAILVKTTSMLEREVCLRELGNGAIRDATVRNMLSWTKAALERVMVPEPDSGFRPHRLRVTGAGFPAVRAVPPLYAFVDRAMLTRRDDSFGYRSLSSYGYAGLSARGKRFA